MKSASLNEAAPDEIYLPFRQLPRSTGTVVVRTDGEPAALQSTMRSALASVDGTVALTFFTTMDSALGSSLIFQRITAWLTGAFAGVALLLSAVGLYSVIAYAITQRTGEIGLRMALGAQREQVVRLILHNGLRLVALGLFLGFGLAAGVGRFTASLLYDVQPLDPLIYGGVAVLFAAVSTLACLQPALRASRIDPSSLCARSNSQSLSISKSRSDYLCAPRRIEIMPERHSNRRLRRSRASIVRNAGFRSLKQ